MIELLSLCKCHEEKMNLKKQSGHLAREVFVGGVVGLVAVGLVLDPLLLPPPQHLGKVESVQATIRRLINFPSHSSSCAKRGLSFPRNCLPRPFKSSATQQ